MLKISKVSYDLCERGPAIAHPVIIVEFDNVEEQHDLVAEFDEAIEKANLQNTYKEACSYKQAIYFLFKGRIFTKENIPLYMELFNKISKDAADLQKALLAAKTINVGQLKPPFFMWEGIPQDFTGVENAYTDFNIPYVVIDETTEYSQIALQQILNHPMGTVFIRWTSKEATPTFIKDFEDTFHGYHVFLLAKKDVFKEAKSWALENAYCLYLDQSE